MKRLVLALLLLAIFATSCARQFTGLKRKFEAKERHYVVEQYSGGVKIREYSFTGILNNSKRSDGYYWFATDTLYEVSGDLVIRSWP